MPALHVAIAVVAGTTGGPATYGRRLVAALGERDDVRVSVLTDAPQAFAAGGAARGVEIVPVPMRGGLDRLRWQYVALGKVVHKLRADVYHDTKNALPLRLSVPSVVTVHDLAYHTVPQTFPWASRTFLRLATRHAAARATRVIVPSQATADDLLRIHSGTSGRVDVVPHGIDAFVRPDDATLAETRARLSLPEHFVLHVGTLQARKNVDLVIAGVRQLRAQGLPHRAVIVGRQGWRAGATLAELRADDTAQWLPHVTAADLPAVYALADAFVSPSAYEGFGFSVADALAAGVPTVIADVSSLPELCGDAAVRLTELSADAVARCLRPLLTDPAAAAARRERGPRRAAEFSWTACAAGHVRAYRAASGGSR